MTEIASEVGASTPPVVYVDLAGRPFDPDRLDEGDLYPLQETASPYLALPPTVEEHLGLLLDALEGLLPKQAAEKGDDRHRSLDGRGETGKEEGSEQDHDHAHQDRVVNNRRQIIILVVSYPVANGGATSVQHTHPKVTSLPSNNPLRALRTDPALAYIQAHWAEKITLDEVAKACDMSPRELSATFRREHNGVPLKSFIVSHRPDRSCEFLKHGKAVKFAAASSGFKDESYFSRAFKARFKMTPTEFKERCSLDT